MKALSPNRTEHKEVPLRNGREDDGLTESARVLLAEDWLDLKFLGLVVSGASAFQRGAGVPRTGNPRCIFLSDFNARGPPTVDWYFDRARRQFSKNYDELRGPLRKPSTRVSERTPHQRPRIVEIAPGWTKSVMNALVASHVRQLEAKLMTEPRL